jgi:uncharacterized protein YktB (UPF0637 family)
MAIQPFTAGEFQIFDIPGFAERMAAIRAEIRPKLEALGDALAPSLAHVVKVEIFPHVARHARRTVNPPDDTWVAFGPDRRGYKKAPHFKVAVSRHALRFLFEVGPEFGAKPAFARAWKRQAPGLARALTTARGLGWFKNEHDEEPAAVLADLDLSGWKALADELGRTRDGQLVLGRRVDAREAAKWRGPEYEKAALDTFAALGTPFTLAGH